MGLLSKNINTYDSINYSKISSVEYDKDAFFITAANSSVVSMNYPDYLNEIRNLKFGDDCLKKNPRFCEILVNEFTKPRDNSIGGSMDFFGFNLVDTRNNAKLTLNDIKFINEYLSCESIDQIYVFKENTYTEFWFEVNDTSDEIEDDIFLKYSLFKKISDSIIKIIIFSKDELYKNANIEYDILLSRKG